MGNGNKEKFEAHYSACVNLGFKRGAHAYGLPPPSSILPGYLVLSHYLLEENCEILTYWEVLTEARPHIGQLYKKQGVI